MHEGSPATQGTGPEQYSLRLVFQMSPIDRFDLLPISFELSGHAASILLQDHFYVLRIGGFDNSHEAERFAELVQGAMLELTATRGVTLWVESLVPVNRNESPMNVQIRDGLAEQYHPEWARRADGTITDGGIFPNQSCILAERERIWEYPLIWGTPVRQIGIAALKGALHAAAGRTNLHSALNNQRLRAGVKFLNLAHGEPNREVSYVLYATVLETLADEDMQEGAKKIVAQCRRANGEPYDETEGGELYRIRNKLVHEGIAKLDGCVLSATEFAERYRQIQKRAMQAVKLKFDQFSS